MKKYPRAYEAIRSELEWEVEQGILRADRLEPCLKTVYGHQCRAIRLGLCTEEDVLSAFQLPEAVSCEEGSRAREAVLKLDV